MLQYDDFDQIKMSFDDYNDSADRLEDIEYAERLLRIWREKPYNHKLLLRVEKYVNAPQIVRHQIREREKDAARILGLEKIVNKAASNKIDRGLLFIEEKGILDIHGQEVLISKQRDSNSISLLKTLFKDKVKEWNRDEILEDWGYNLDDQLAAPKKVVYTPCSNIQNKIAAQTDLKDFLIFGMKHAQINPKYL
jgi:hypothetical protein